MDFRLPKSLLFETADFEQLFKAGNKKFGAYFALHYCKLDSKEANAHRFGMSVAKKSVGTNVRRNLIKRVIRETYRLKQHDLVQYQVLVVAKRDLKKRIFDRTQLREDLCRLFASLS